MLSSTHCCVHTSAYKCAAYKCSNPDNTSPSPSQGTILPGVTRRSIIELARDRGYSVEEVPVSADEAMEADEVFTTGTAVVVSPVGSLTHKGVRRQYGKEGESGMCGLGVWGGEGDGVFCVTMVCVT